MTTAAAVDGQQCADLTAKCAALYSHWRISVSVRQSITNSAPQDRAIPLHEDVTELAQLHSSFIRLSVWYALLYEVVEGYRDLGLEDAAIDSLLSDDEYVAGIRRFRNATFHYEPEPFSDRRMTFSDLAGATEWTRALDGAFEAFFMRSLPIKAMLADSTISQFIAADASRVQIWRSLQSTSWWPLEW